MSATGRTGPEWILESATLGVVDSERTHLLECARRVWPGLKAFGRRAMATEGSIDERDRFSSEVWEEVLVLTAKTVAEGKRPVVDLEAYLAASFRYRFLRKARKEKKLRERVQFLSSEELDAFRELETGDSQLTVEDKLQVKQITQQMDEWTITVWNSLVYGMSWKEIGKALGIRQEQAKQKFRYELKKIKARLQQETSGR